MNEEGLFGLIKTNQKNEQIGFSSKEKRFKKEATKIENPG